MHERQRGDDGNAVTTGESAERAPSAAAEGNSDPHKNGRPPSQYDAREDERRALSAMGFEAGPRPLLDSADLG